MAGGRGSLQFRSVTVTRATNRSAPRAKVKRASGKAKRASATG
jgi:hypothetical protein